MLKMGQAERAAFLSALAAARARAPAPTLGTALLDSVKGFGGSVMNLFNKAVASVK
jgi:hypothetical protein